MMSVPFSSIAAPVPVALTILPCKVAVVVMLLPVLMVPKPEAIEPLESAPVPVMLAWTAEGSVWLRLGTLLPSVTNTLLAAAAVA